MFDEDISYDDFKPQHHSSVDEEKPGSFEYLLSSSEIKEIIQETEDFLDLCLEKVMDQEKALSSLVYRMYHMDSDMNAYKTLVDQQTRYVVNYNTLFSDYFRYLSQALPNYGDFNVALQQTTEGTPGGLPRDEANDVCKKVRDLTYMNWLSLRAQHSIVKDVGYWVTKRKSAVGGFERKKTLWLDLVENAICQLKRRVDIIVKLKVKFHFYGMSKIIDADNNGNFNPKHHLPMKKLNISNIDDADMIYGMHDTFQYESSNKTEMEDEGSTDMRFFQKIPSKKTPKIMEIADVNISYNEFNPQHHSSMKPLKISKLDDSDIKYGDSSTKYHLPTKKHKIDDTDLSFSDFRPEHHSSIKNPKLTEMADADLSYGGFNPQLHSTMKYQQNTEMDHTDTEYGDFRPNHHSSVKKPEIYDGDLSFSHFTPEHHSSITNPKLTEIDLDKANISYGGFNPHQHHSTMKYQQKSEMADADIEYRDFRPNHLSLVKKPEIDDTDLSFSDFTPEDHSSMTNPKLTAIGQDNSDLSYSGFNSQHHSTMRQHQKAEMDDSGIEISKFRPNNNSLIKKTKTDSADLSFSETLQNN